MRAGGGHGKGAGFEREVCRLLSLWITKGEDTDTFWRSAMSGGRATLLAKKGKRGANAAGDICATGAAGHALTDRYFIECKFYARLDILPFLLGQRRGKLWTFWEQVCAQAAQHHKAPMLIARQNQLPAFVVMFPSSSPQTAAALLEMHGGLCVYWFAELFPTPKPKLKEKG